MRDKPRKRRKKGKENAEPLTFEMVVLACIRGSFEETIGEEEQMSIESLSFDRFESLLDSIEKGVTIESFSKVQQNALIFFLPDGVNRTESLPGRLAPVYFLGEDAMPGPSLSFPKPYKKEEKNMLLWQASGCVIYKVGWHQTGADIVLYLLSDREFEKNIRGKLKDPEFENSVRSLVFKEKNEETGPAAARSETDAAPGGLEIAKPLEFCLGMLFLPPCAVVGKKKIHCTFKRIVEKEAVDRCIPRDGLWYRFSFRAADRDCSVYYGVDVKGRQKKYEKFFSKLFPGLLRISGKKLRKEIPFSAAKGGMTAKPKDDVVSRSAVFEAEIGMGRQRVPCLVCVDRIVLGILARRILEPWERSFLQPHPRRELLMIPSLNRTLLSLNINSFYREGLDRDIPENGLPGLYGLRVSELINLVDDDDVKRIIQNYFIGSGFTVGDMQKLFFFKAGPDEKGRVKTAIDPSFDNPRFARLLPLLPREDWKGVFGVSENYHELLENNAVSMQGIYKAVSHDKLLLSFKSRYILDSEFREKIEAEYLERIESLLAKGEPLRTLQILSRETAQQVVSAVPTKKLAVALLSRTEDVRAYGVFMSRNKRQELAEEIKVQKRRRESGLFTAELIYDYLLELLDTFKRAVEKQRARLS